MVADAAAGGQTDLAMRELQARTPAPAPLPASTSSAHPSSLPASSTTSTSSLPPAKTVSSYLAANPKSTPGKAISHLFPKKNPISRLIHRFQVKHSVINGLSAEELHKWEKKIGPQARRRAGWKLEGEQGEGAVVSELFWKVS